MKTFESCKYTDGQFVMLEDKVDIGNGFRSGIILSIFPPDHEISIFYEMEQGCVEISPNTIEELPLDQDIQLINRA